MKEGRTRRNGLQNSHIDSNSGDCCGAGRRARRPLPNACPRSGRQGGPARPAEPTLAVTAFLEACHDKDYGKAAQYLQLDRIPVRQRAQQGPQLARDLESILNSDSRFDALQLSQSEQGNLTDDPEPSIENVATVTYDGQAYTLELNHVMLPNGPFVWVFSSATVAAIPKLAPPSTQSAIEARLPRFLVALRILDTPLWKWIALISFALLTLLVFRLVVRLLVQLLRALETWRRKPGGWAWVRAILEPVLVLLCVMGFRIAEQLIDPSALGRLYLGRVLLLLVVWSIAWGVSNLIEFFLNRVDLLLNPKQRVVSHSLLYLGRRVARAVVVIFAAVIVLSNWGYDMTTLIAGLGVGGIAVALAAQQTIANVFGGVSVIGDNPIMVGDFGNFGGLLGTVEDIGMRSTRVRTLSRTVVSVPNSAFAGMNIENYSVRDKILFNPSFQIKRATPKDQLRKSMESLTDLLSRDKRVDVVSPPVRITALSSAAFTLEVFAYVMTTDINEFYGIEADLYLAIDDALGAAGIELA